MFLNMTRAAALTLAGLGAAPALAQTAPAPAPTAPSGEPIKDGILHSLSGTMAISETTLKDAMLMLIDQQNAKGKLVAGFRNEQEPMRTRRRALP